MRWIGGRQSDHVEDRRGMTVSRGVIGGGIGTIILVVKESNMLWTICVILLILWLLGFIGGYAAGGLIHILLVIAIVVVVIQVIQGRRG